MIEGVREPLNTQSVMTMKSKYGESEDDDTDKEASLSVQSRGSACGVMSDIVGDPTLLTRENIALMDHEWEEKVINTSAFGIVSSVTI
jgi:hypothetical protein